MDKSILYIIGLMAVVLAITISMELWFDTPAPVTAAMQIEANNVKLQHLILKRDQLRVCLAILKSGIVYSPIPEYCK